MRGVVSTAITYSCRSSSSSSSQVLITSHAITHCQNITTSALNMQGTCRLQTLCRQQPLSLNKQKRSLEHVHMGEWGVCVRVRGEGKAGGEMGESGRREETKLSQGWGEIIRREEGRAIVCCSPRMRLPSSTEC